MTYLFDPAAAEKRRNDIRYAQRFRMSKLVDGVREVDWSQLTNAVHAAGAPAPLAGASLKMFFDSNHKVDVADALAEMVRGESDKYGVVLSGRPRTGKTSIAIAAMRYALRHGNCVRFVSYEEYLRLLQRRLDIQKSGSTGDEYLSLMEEWEQERYDLERVYDLLVVDDYARITAPEFFTQDFHTLLRHRYDAGLYTIVVSNLSREQLREVMNERLSAFLRSEFRQFGFDEASRIA